MSMLYMCLCNNSVAAVLPKLARGVGPNHNGYPVRRRDALRFLAHGKLGRLLQTCLGGRRFEEANVHRMIRSMRFHASCMGVILVLGGFAGCIMATNLDEVHIVNGVEYHVQFHVDVEDPSGFMAFTVENPRDLMAYVSYETRWDPSGFMPFHFIFLTEAGEDVVLVHPEYGRAESETIERTNRHFLSHNTTKGLLLVTWANLEAPARIETWWLEGTRIIPEAESSVVAATLADFTDGDGATVPGATARIEDTLRVDAPHDDVYAVVKVPASIAHGELVITDDTGERVIPLGGAPEFPHMRYIVSATGDTTFTVTYGAWEPPPVDGAWPFDVYLVAVTVPRGILPEQEWREVREPS
jgi:hypothetical protein